MTLDDKLALTVLDFCKAGGIGRTKFYQLVKQGRIKIIKCGRRTLVPVHEAKRWLRELEGTSGER